MAFHVCVVARKTMQIFVNVVTNMSSLRMYLLLRLGQALNNLKSNNTEKESFCVQIQIRLLTPVNYGPTKFQNFGE